VGGLNYRQSGVDTVAVADALRSLLAGLTYRAPASSGRPLTQIGHYAGIIRIGRESLAITTDTVGTKVLLAEQMGRWEEVGEDLVAINVNDLSAVGARPAALVDVISVPRADATIFGAIGRGINRGLRAARCSLLGGETAMVPDLVRGTDLGGTAVGFFPQGRRPILGRGIRPGDVLIGLPSRGLHSNGFTLVRKILETQQLDPRDARPGGTVQVGEELLAPTRIYAAAIEAIAQNPSLHGLAHISGGGIRNLLRLHPSRCFVLDAWPPVPPLFQWLAERGELSAEEQYQTFNMGIGFVLAVAARGEDSVIAALRRAGEPGARRIGRVTAGRGVRVPDARVEFASYR
jgi:phosphoribosylformylglycinamidine cyclo-ligase